MRCALEYMAKLRRNYSTHAGTTGTMVRVVVAAAVLIALAMVMKPFMDTQHKESVPSNSRVLPADVTDEPAYYFPDYAGTCQIIQHRRFSLCYVEAHEQAAWVAYILTRQRLEAPWTERPDRFERDAAVKTGSAHWMDYRESGYDRGHLAPAADMAFDPVAIEESFLMSNISPQVRGFNAGIWRELEELARDWAKANKKLYVVTGPVLDAPNLGQIGKNKITVPGAFYKILLDLSEPEQKGIAFIIPNAVSYRSLSAYAMSIDSAEVRLGMNFFANLMTSDVERLVESRYSASKWPLSKQKFELRVNRWNQIK